MNKPKRRPNNKASNGIIALMDRLRNAPSPLDSAASLTHNVTAAQRDLESRNATQAYDANTPASIKQVSREQALEEESQCGKPCNPAEACGECEEYWHRMRKQGLWNDETGWSAEALKQDAT
jgi:hypothetical protein